MPAVVSIVISKKLQELEKELAKEVPRFGPEFHIPEENIDSQGMVKIGGGSGFIVDKKELLSPTAMLSPIQTRNTRLLPTITKNSKRKF